MSRSPRGERGLKQQGGTEERYRARSLPSRGAWIETFYPAVALARAAVAPLAGSVD